MKKYYKVGIEMEDTDTGETFEAVTYMDGPSEKAVRTSIEGWDPEEGLACVVLSMTEYTPELTEVT